MLLTLGLGVGGGSAGSLDSPGPPTGPLSASYSLEDVYHRLETGAPGTQRTFTEPPSGPTAGTGHTLNEIMGKAPAPDNTSGAAAGDVLNGRTFWGLRTDGTWGLKTGALSSGSDVSGGDGQKTFAIPDGCYSGRTATANDTNLTGGNIKSGVSIFGVTGSPNVVDTGSGDVTADDIKCGKKAWAKGVEISGRPRFKDNGDGTVTDNNTGLIWLKNAGCFIAMNWQDAMNAAATLKGDDTQCGLMDGSTAGQWRLPKQGGGTPLEWNNLLNVGYANPALTNGCGNAQWTEGDAFNNVLSLEYWSSTEYDENNAFFVNLWSGSTFAQGKYTVKYIWPVRNGP